MLFKYYMTDKSKTLPCGTVLYRIVACRNFGTVKKGDIGGWIEATENLSHEGNCWVADEAMVCGFSRVSEDAVVRNNAVVNGYCRIFGNAIICDQALLTGSVYVFGNAVIGGESILAKQCSVHDNATVFCLSRRTRSQENLAANIMDNAIVRGNACLYGKVSVRDNAIIEDNATISESARIYEDGRVSGNAVVRSQASVCDHGWIMGNAILCDRAKVAGSVRLAGLMILSGRTFMTGWGIRGGKAELRDKIVSGDGSLIYDRFHKKKGIDNVAG